MDDLGKKTLGAVAEEVKKTAKATVLQLGVEGSKENEKGEQTTQQIEAQQATQQSNEDFVNSLYAPSKQPTQPEVKKENPTQQLFERIAKDNPGKTQEELQQMLSDYQRQHKETYYDPTFNPPPKQQEEERPAEKVEREKEEERWKLQEKEKEKPPPLAVQREKNKTEQFRGASG